MHCQRFSVEVNRGADTTFGVFSLDLEGRGERRTLVQQSSDLKTSDRHKTSSSSSKKHKQLIILLKPFKSGGDHVFFCRVRKETTKKVSQAVFAIVFSYCCGEGEQEMKNYKLTMSRVLPSCLSSRREMTSFPFRFSNSQRKRETMFHF